MNYLSRIIRVAARECGILVHNPIYLFCMVLFPVFAIFFFTSLLDDGQPLDIPCGIVDHDKSSISRAMIRQLNAFENTRVTAYYQNVNEAREAIQRGEIYGFLYIPENMSQQLLGNRQPTISFYHSNVVLTAGGMLARDLKVVTTLTTAKIAATKLAALGKSNHEIQAFLQPITIDMHAINNPWINYNAYLTTIMVPGVFMLFMLLITVYSIGTELKFDRSREWIQTAGGNIYIAITGKILPHFLIFLTITLSYFWYIFGPLGFPHQGGLWRILLLSSLTVLSAEGFGIFIFGLMPSLRMSMSICSLWAMLGFSISGATYPVYAMDGILEALSWLFPLRHYFMIYQVSVFNGYPLHDCWLNVIILIAFALLPLFNITRIKKAMLEYVYIP